MRKLVIKIVFITVKFATERSAGCGLVLGPESKDGKTNPVELPLRQHVQLTGHPVGRGCLHALWLCAGAVDGLCCNGRQFRVRRLLLVAVEDVQEALAGLSANARVSEVGGEWRLVGPRGDFGASRIGR